MYKQFAILCMSSFGPIQNAIDLIRILQFANEHESENICSSFHGIVVGVFLRIIV